MSRKYFTVKILYEYWQPSAVGGFGLRLKKASVFWAESGRATDNGGVAWCDMNKNLQQKNGADIFKRFAIHFNCNGKPWPRNTPFHFGFKCLIKSFICEIYLL